MFHRPIPEDVAMNLFSHVGLKSITDTSWFRRKDVEIALNKITDDLVLIEPYYMPHKKFYLHREMTPPRILCIFRHIAKCFGRKIELMEKGRFGEKQFYYRIVNPELPMGSMTVTFD
jgi:hypothetical protein